MRVYEDLIEQGINPKGLRNSIPNSEHNTINYWSRERDYTDEQQQIDGA